MKYVWVIALSGALGLFTGMTQAGEWHVGASLVCSQCHAEHGSAGGEPIPGGPYSTLLLKGSINELCLSCHDGSDPTAPDVLAPVSMYAQAVPSESAAGHFLSAGTMNLGGHTLGVASAVPLNSAGRSLALDCGNCHDYHGNTNYRNLRYDPTGGSDSIDIAAGVDVFWNAAPSNPPTPAGSAVAYARVNIGYKSGWARWCGTCHDQLVVNTPTTPPAHFNLHPSEVSIGQGSAHTAVNHWIAGSGEGFTGSPFAGEGIPRVPYLQPQATDFTTSQQVQSTNRVFCGSCHAAHGTANTMNLRWPYVDGGANYLSGCQQCHHK